MPYFPTLITYIPNKILLFLCTVLTIFLQIVFVDQILRSLTQDVIPFLNNIIFQYTNPLSFETGSHNKHTIPLAREHYDFFYITSDTKQ